MFGFLWYLDYERASIKTKKFLEFFCGHLFMGSICAKVGLYNCVDKDLKDSPPCFFFLQYLLTEFGSETLVQKRSWT